MRTQLTFVLFLLTFSVVGTSTAQSRSGGIMMSSEGDGNGDRFGATVSLSNNGDRIAIMAPDNGRFGRDEPQAEVYELQGSSWIKLGDTFDDYTSSPLEKEATITISGSGTTVATGEPAFDTPQHLSAGKVQTFRYSQGSWTSIGNEKNGSYRDARYGEKVLLLNNGSQMMTGNFGGDGSDPRGVFNLVLNGTWDPVGTQPILQSNNEVALSGIALSEQGLIVAVGLDRDANLPGEIQRFLFSGDWVSLGRLEGAVNGDGFGTSIAMGNNGRITAVGAPYDGTGKVRVYDNSNNQIGSTIVAPAGSHTFGYSIDISEDGNTLAIGAPANDPPSEGMGGVYVYELVGSNWTLEYTFRGTQMGEQMGQSVSLSNDGMHLAIGRPGFGRQGTDNDAGEVDVFLLDGSSSTTEETLLELQAFPNPTNAELHLSGLPQGESTVFVRDALGRLILRIDNVIDRVDVSNLTPGHYNLEVRKIEGVGRIPFVKK